MTVKVSKPAINVREELADLKKPTGVAGEAMLRAETPQEQFQLIGAGRRNLIINGGFDVWQRGNSGGGATGYHSADRWKFNTYSAGTILLTKRTDAVGQDFTTYARFEQSVVDTTANAQGLMHIIEGSYAVGKPVTVSFKAKANATLANCQIRGVFAGQFFDLTTDWQTFTFTGTALATGNNVRILLDFGAANTLWSVDLAQFQLEVGKVATPFEHRSYGEELALCQRYYYAFQVAGGDPLGENCFMATAYSSNTMYAPITFPVQMRSIPSVISGGSWASRRGNNVSFTAAFGTQRAGLNNVTIAQSINSSSGTNTGDAYWVEPDSAVNPNTAYLAFNSEL